MNVLYMIDVTKFNNKQKKYLLSETKLKFIVFKEYN